MPQIDTAYAEKNLSRRGLWHIENGDPLGRLELKHFFRKAGVRGDIGKFYDSGIAQSIFKTDLQNE